MGLWKQSVKPKKRWSPETPWLLIRKNRQKLRPLKGNSLLPKLPLDVLQSVILMKAVSSNNPKYGRNDFQREMLAVVGIIKGGTAKKA